MNNKHRLIHGDCLEVLRTYNHTNVACIFADPPDNLGLPYEDYDDKKEKDVYLNWLDECLRLFIKKAGIVWLSYNAKYTFEIGRIVCGLLRFHPWLEARHCIQTFTFGQHRQTDLGNNHRPLLRLRRDDAPLYPDQIRVQSWRQKHGDPRADPRGKVPGDVFDIPRVTGNSKQRRSWCPTQLNEDLVERCVAFSTLPGQRVLDPFAGTGTTMRVCEKIDRPCTLIEYSLPYCRKIGEEHGLEVEV